MAFKDYLPSRELQKKLLAIVIIIAIILAIFFTVRLVKFLINKRWVNKQIKNLPVELRDQVDTLTVGDLQKKDSNNNGFPDWEERLYGLDPFGDGVNNKQQILDKKEKLRIATGASDERTPEMSTNTGKFSREFLSIVLSLQQSGALNKNSIDDISKSIGTELIPTELKDYIKKSDLKVIRDTEITHQAYFTEILDVVDKSSAAPKIGMELDMLADGLQSDDPTKFVGLDEIGYNYKLMADEFKKVSVPEKFAGDHLALVNSLYNISESLSMIKQLGSDPIIGLQGFYAYGYATGVMDDALNSLAEE